MTGAVFRLRGAIVSGIVAMAGVLACAPRTVVDRPGSAPAGAGVQAAGAGDTATLGRWIEVRKRARRLTVYEDTTPVRTYRIVLGRDPLGAKMCEGDNRTPEGEYHIAAKYSHRLWSRFLLLDYPTEMNRLLYEWSRAGGLLPRRAGSIPLIGGEVGIHGTADESRNRRGENWTRGCVSLLNRDIEELYSLVDVGTRVVIEK